MGDNLIVGKLNSHNDWSPLKEIIVGSAKNYAGHEREITFDIFFHEHLYRSDWAYPRLTNSSRKAAQHIIAEQYALELGEDVEAFAALLQSLGITVFRPTTQPSHTETIGGFGWQATPVPALNIRDNTLIFGSEIIETPPAIRSRYLETRLLSHLFASYFRNGAKWTTMPRPLLTEMSFDLSYATNSSTTLGGPTEPIYDPQVSPFDVGFEMMLDGAQCLRLGLDVVVNIAQTNHELACVWLERHLSPKYRIHKVYRLSDNHIDSMILALRPGVFLARHEGIQAMMPPVFQKWRYIVPPEPRPGDFPVYKDDVLVLTSPYIDLNVLSIDEERVLVNENCEGLMRSLDLGGFTPIPVRHRHRRLFGGGFHCFTLDTVREGQVEDYR